MAEPERAPRRRIKIDALLHNDQQKRWPLFIVNGVGDEPDRAPISNELKHDLRVWTGYYREHYDPDGGGWIPADSVLAYNRLGRRLANRLAGELGPRFRVLLDVHESLVDECGWEQVSGVWQYRHDTNGH